MLPVPEIIFNEILIFQNSALNIFLYKPYHLYLNSGNYKNSSCSSPRFPDNKNQRVDILSDISSFRRQGIDWRRLELPSVRQRERKRGRLAHSNISNELHFHSPQKPISRGAEKCEICITGSILEAEHPIRDSVESEANC